MNDRLTHVLRRIRRAAGLRGVFVHLAVFAVAVAVAYVTHLDWQLFYPLLGWSFGLLLHAVSALAAGEFIERRWEEDQVERAFAARTSPAEPD